MRLFVLWFVMVGWVMTVAAQQETVRLPRKETMLPAWLTGEEKLEVYRFRAGETELVVMDEGNPAKPRYGSLAAALAANGCRTGSNGGYFAAGEAGVPLGLVRHEGKTVSRLATKGFSVAGVLYDDGKTLRLERSHRLSIPAESMREAVQGGPFLVEAGRAIAGLNAQKSACRTFIATDGRGNWCLGISTPMTLRALADHLARPGTLRGFRVQTALNLDGGSSTALQCNGQRVQSNLKPVRNYIGLRPRRKR
ncbi:MAG: phosphodiester glycosidase family protein [Akkermansia sp.]